ncbi:O-antigen polymerase [Spirosoma fluminis]
MVNILYLRELAKYNTLLQLLASTFYLFCFVFFPESEQAVIICGSAAIIISLFPIAYVIAIRQFPLIFSCICAINVAPIWFLYLEAVLPGYDAYVYSTAASKLHAFYWISVFQIFLNFFYYICWYKFTPTFARDLTFLKKIDIRPSDYVWLTMISFLLPLFIFYLFHGSSEALWKSIIAGRTENAGTGLVARESAGGISSLMLPFEWLWQLTPLFSTVAFITLSKRAYALKLLCLICGILVIFSFFLSGSRGIMIFVASPMIFFLFYYNYDKGLKFWGIAILLFFIVIGIMEVQVRFRGGLLDVISDPTKAAKSQGLESATSFDPTKTHRDNNMYLFCLITTSHPDKYPFEGFNDYFAIILNPIPRYFWPEKPLLDGAKDISSMSAFISDGPLTMGTTSLTYSVVGEAFLSAGIFGIIIYAFTYVLFLLYFDGIILHSTKQIPLTIGVLGVGVFLMFWGYRSFFALVTFFYPILLFISIARLVNFIKR